MHVNEIIPKFPNEVLKFWDQLLAWDEKISYVENPTIPELKDVSGTLIYSCVDMMFTYTKKLAIIYSDGVIIYWWKNGWISQHKMLRIINLKAFI